MSNRTEDNSGGSVTTNSAVTENRAENQTETDASTESILEEYKMGNKRRGRALIFNQERFFWRLDLNERRGTNADRDNLEKRLKNLNFEVSSYDNCKQEEVLDKIAEAAEEDHSDADCFLLAFLSHGEDDHVYCHDGKISIREITSMFKGNKCESLVGKPKIFIIQACRGNQYDEAVAVTPASFPDTETKVDVDACAMRTLPAGADFIMCYSVAEGYYSFRETKNGSWYIQDLCEMIQKYGETLEFTELLTLVNSKVSKRNIPVPCPPKLIGKKQMPCFASMLTKKLYFRPKKDQCHTSVFK